MSGREVRYVDVAVDGVNKVGGVAGVAGGRCLSERMQGTVDLDPAHLSWVAAGNQQAALMIERETDGALDVKPMRAQDAAVRRGLPARNHVLVDFVVRYVSDGDDARSAANNTSRRAQLAEHRDDLRSGSDDLPEGGDAGFDHAARPIRRAK